MLDKTQLVILVVRSMNWILNKFLMSVQREWEIWLRFNEGISWIKIRPLRKLFLYCFYTVMFFMNIFTLKLIWNIMNYFFMVKMIVASSQQLTCFRISLPHGITVNTHCLVTMGRWHCLSNYIMSPTVSRCFHWYQTIMWPI